MKTNDMKNLVGKIHGKMIFVVYPLMFFITFFIWRDLGSLIKITFLLFLFGGGLNFLVMTVNGFSMPVTNSLVGKREGYHIINKKTKLSYLSDVFTLVIPFKKRSIIFYFSVGDFFIYIGAIAGGLYFIV